MILPIEVIRSIPQWKREYGSDFVYLWDIGGTPVVYRGATISEYSSYYEIEEKNRIEAEEWLVSSAVLWPQPLFLNDMPVMAPQRLCEKILEASGLRDPEQLIKRLDSAREAQKTTLYNGSALIASCFNIDPDAVLNFTVDKFCRYLAMAESIKGVRLGMPNDKKPRRRGSVEMPNVPDYIPPTDSSDNKIDFNEEARELANMGLGFEP